MKTNLRSLAAAGGLLASLVVCEPVLAQKPGGILRMPSGDSPASMSIHEESTIAVLGPMMTFTLREGVKWHDGKPFTARDVKCTWDLIAAARGHFLQITVPGFARIPCHVSPRDMRSHPIGTGPFKFGEFKPNETIRVAKNLDYWKKDRPYLDGIEWTIIRNPSTAIMAFAAGNFDRFGQGILSIPLMKEIQKQTPHAVCEVVPWNISRALIVNHGTPPFDNLDLRRAMALSLDRQAFIDILSDGQGEIGGAMMPPPAGLWGMPLELLKTLPGYDPDIAKNRVQARALMQNLGYGPDKRLGVTVTTRNVPPYRDAAVILIDQLKEIYIDGVLEAVDTTQWYPKVMRKDYTVGLTVSENGLDDPDQQFYENFVCGAERNYTGYCSPEVDKLVDQQSIESDTAKRKQLVWEIERRLAEDAARPIIFYPRSAACWQPQFNGHTMTINGNYNNWRLEDAWLDK